MSDWNFLNKRRIRTGQYGSTDDYGFNGAFEFMVTGFGNPTHIRCIASDGLGWQHVSVSIIDKPSTPPSWAVMCHVKDLFWEEDEAVIQIHPKKSEYVNHHKGCLHLWRCLDREQPLPESILVGPKEDA